MYELVSILVIPSVVEHVSVSMGREGVPRHSLEHCVGIALRRIVDVRIIEEFLDTKENLAVEAVSSRTPQY